MCLNTHALVLINQYSTGLFVNYFTHEKTQLYENIDEFAWQEMEQELLEFANNLLDKREAITGGINITDQVPML